MNDSVVARSQKIVVKFADTAREKERRKLEKQLRNAALQLRELCSEDEDELITNVIIPSQDFQIFFKI